MAGLLVFLCKSCLKSGSTSVLYEELGVDARCDVEAVKKAYKKLSLSLHPDKIAQRGGVVTDEDKARLLRVKEAYTVLVDPKRRRLYDQLGETGLKLVEDPTALMAPEMQAKVIGNFQKNAKDRYLLLLLILAVYSSIASFPILFAAKCDGYIPGVSWAALWTPLWLADLVLLLGAFFSFVVREEVEDEEGNPKPVPFTAADWADCSLNLALSSLYTLLQVFLVLRLDRAVLWSWFAVFAPWFAYDGLSLLARFHPAFLATVPHPDAKIKNKGKDKGKEEDKGTGKDKAGAGAGAGADADADAEKGEGGKSKQEQEQEDEEQSEEEKFEAEADYYQHLMQQRADQQGVALNAARIWLAAFLATKLNNITNTISTAEGQAQAGADWSWWLVLLPVWVFVAYKYAAAVKALLEGQRVAAALAQQLQEQHQQRKLSGLGSGSDEEEGGPDGFPMGPSEMLKAQHAQVLQSSFLGACCCSAPAYLLVFVLLASSLSGASAGPISTFIVVLPVFVVLLALLVVAVCAWGCLACVDTEALSGALGGPGGGEGSGSGSGSGSGGGGGGGGAEAGAGEARFAVPSAQAQAKAQAEAGAEALSPVPAASSSTATAPVFIPAAPALAPAAPALAPAEAEAAAAAAGLGSGAVVPELSTDAAGAEGEDQGEGSALLAASAPTSTASTASTPAPAAPAAAVAAPSPAHVSLNADELD